MKRRPAFLAPLLGALLVPAAGRAAERIDFQRDIRPLLSDFCFKCHGPDDKARKGKLRLDLRATALAGLDLLVAIHAEARVQQFAAGTAPL